MRAASSGLPRRRRTRRGEGVGLGDLLDRHLAVGADDGEGAVIEPDIDRGRFQHLRRLGRAFSITLSAVSDNAAPPTGIEREPPVPEPKLIRALSPWTISMSSAGMPSRAETIWV